MAKFTWDELLQNPDFIGGDLEWKTHPRHYGGNITSFRDYGNRITIHFEWAAAKVSFGWSEREIRKVTLRKGEFLQELDQPGKPLQFSDGNLIRLKGTSRVTREQVVPQRQHR